jgi:A/G-specific adenine glycosylase
MALDATRNTQAVSYAALVRALLQWFATNARDLPWRHTLDPYAIWVSEIMLQQTQVKTVIPYWERWMSELPTIESLARAPLPKIHKLWEGLGYYTRVRNMQKAAQEIVAKHDGKFPAIFEDVFELTGIGRYTAGAICSIAFNQPQPILDGNVIRVLTRIFGITTGPHEKETNARLWDLAKELVSTANFSSLVNGGQFSLSPGERVSNNAKLSGPCSALNQSLMELGALICTPRAPKCEICPAAKLCIARKTNTVDQIPALKKRDAATRRYFIAFVVERRGKFLVRQRPEGIVNSHLWEFPNVEVMTGSARRSNNEKLCQKAGFTVTSDAPLCVIKHSITRYRITLEAYSAQLADSKPKSDGKWLTVKQLQTIAFSSAHKRILECIVNSDKETVG